MTVAQLDKKEILHSYVLEVSDKARQTKEPGYNKGLSSVQSMDCVIADMGVTQFPKREAIKNASYS